MTDKEKAIAFFNGRPVWSSLLVEDLSSQFAVKDLQGGTLQVRQIHTASGFEHALVYASTAETIRIVGGAGIVFDEAIEIPCANIYPRPVLNLEKVELPEFKGETVKIELEEIPAPIRYIMEGDEYVRTWEEGPQFADNTSAIEYCFDELMTHGEGGNWFRSLFDADVYGLVRSEVLELCPEWAFYIIMHKVGQFREPYNFMQITAEQRDEIIELHENGENVKKIAQKLKIGRETVKHFVKTAQAVNEYIEREGLAFDY